MLTLNVLRIGTLYVWRTQCEILILRALAAGIRAAQREAWSSVFMWSAMAWLAGLAAGLTAMALFHY